MKANDNIPQDEFHLAMIVQNAKARGLKWTSGARFRDNNGMSVGYYITKETVACCAIGAASLMSDTAHLNINFFGNDKGYNGLLYNDPNTGKLSSDIMLGIGFRMAMKED